jgi:hypothetical protein
MAARAPALEDFVEVDLGAAGFRRLDVPPVEREKVQALLRASAAARLVATTPMTCVV